MGVNFCMFFTTHAIRSFLLSVLDFAVTLQQQKPKGALTNAYAKVDGSYLTRKRPK